MQPRKQPRELVLLSRNVLKLVYLNVFEVFLPLFQHFRLRVEEEEGELYEVVEVEVIIFALREEILQDDGVQALRLFRLGQAGRDGAAQRVGEEGDVIVFALIVFERVEDVAEGKIFQRQPVLAEDLLQKLLLVFLVDHHEVGGISELSDLFPQDLMAGAVKGQDPPALRLGQHGADAPLHLLRRLVGEGDGEDMVGGYAQRLCDEGIARGENARLTAARARRNAHIPFGRRHRFPLSFVQPREKFFHASPSFSNVCSYFYYSGAGEKKQEICAQNLSFFYKAGEPPENFFGKM